jgi:hypothetical protein
MVTPSEMKLRARVFRAVVNDDYVPQGKALQIQLVFGSARARSRLMIKRSLPRVRFAKTSLVIPGRREAANPESRQARDPATLDSGLAPFGAPRNDDGESCAQTSTSLFLSPVVPSPCILLTHASSLPRGASRLASVQIVGFEPFAPPTEGSGAPKFAGAERRAL